VIGKKTVKNESKKKKNSATQKWTQNRIKWNWG